MGDFHRLRSYTSSFRACIRSACASTEALPTGASNSRRPDAALRTAPTPDHSQSKSISAVGTFRYAVQDPIRHMNHVAPGEAEGVHTQKSIYRSQRGIVPMVARMKARGLPVSWMIE